MLALYTTMVRCRAMAEAAGRTAGDVRDLADGWEATVAGVLGDLLPDDAVIAPRGSRIEEILHAVQAEGGFAQGVANRGSHRANETDESLRADSGAPVSTVGDEFDAARLAALTCHSAKDGRVTVLFCKSPLDTENWRTRLPEVAKQNLPLVVVSYRGGAAKGQKTLANEKARNHATGTLVFGVPVLTVDGSDALAVYRVASESIFRARQRRGPTLIECGWFPAPVPVDATAQGRRGTADSILSLENYLVEKGFLTPALKNEIDRSLRREPNTASRMQLH